MIVLGKNRGTRYFTPGLLKIYLIIYLILLSGVNAFPTDFAVLRKRSKSGKETAEIYALLKAYGDLIERVKIVDDEIILTVGGKDIYYKDGKMLSKDNLAHHADFNSIFYQYRPGPLKEIPPPVEFPAHRASDFLDALIGPAEGVIRASSRWVPFLGHRVFIHRICVEPLKKVEARIRECAGSSIEVQEFISQISIVYSMKRKTIAGTDNLSYHSYGLALDLIPKSYNGKNVYWRWSSVLYPDWEIIPLSRRWHPPDEVITAFEENGFVWGGKWYYFDTVHFEYRPEILYLSETYFDFALTYEKN